MDEHLWSRKWATTMRLCMKNHKARALGQKFGVLTGQQTRYLHDTTGVLPFDSVRTPLYKTRPVQNSLLNFDCCRFDYTMGQLPHSNGYLVIPLQRNSRTDSV